MNSVELNNPPGGYDPPAQPNSDAESNGNDDSTEHLKQDIKTAYKEQDAEKSKQLHQAKMKKRQRKKKHTHGDRENSIDDDDLVIELTNEEQHKSLGDYVKSIIYGGLDGIITTFAIVAGIQGADISTELILVLGFANLIADGLSMGVGDYLSEVAEIDFAKSERDREKWEFDNFQEGEIQEMIEIYQEKGIDRKDADKVLRTMAKYPDFFVDHMMVQELEIVPPTGDEQPAKGGVVTLCSFLMFGSVPLLSYVAFEWVDFEDGFDPKFLLSCILTVLTLFGLGAFKGKITESSMIKSGLFICVNGVAAAGAAYLIAFGLSEVTGVHGMGHR